MVVRAEGKACDGAASMAVVDLIRWWPEATARHHNSFGDEGIVGWEPVKAAAPSREPWIREEESNKKEDDEDGVGWVEDNNNNNLGPFDAIIDSYKNKKHKNLQNWLSTVILVVHL